MTTYRSGLDLRRWGWKLWFTLPAFCSLLLPLPTFAIARGGTAIYFTSTGPSCVGVVDPQTLEIVATIELVRKPDSLTLSSDGRRAYVTHSISREISVIDTSGTQLIHTISLDGESPSKVAVSPDGAYLYATNPLSHSVTVIATASDTVVASIPVGRRPADIVVSPDSRYAYVANESSDDVSLIDLQREKVINWISVSRIPKALALSPDGALLYVANSESKSVSVIAAAVNQVIAEIPVGSSPFALAVSPSGQLLYVASSEPGSLCVIDTTLRRQILVVQIRAGVSSIALSADGRRIYVTSPGDRQLSVLDARTLAVQHRVSSTAEHLQVAVLPQSLHIVPRAESLLSFVFFFLLLLVAVVAVRNGSLNGQRSWCLAGIFVLALALRLAGLDWGIPDYQDGLAASVPELRVSFHLDEDNLIWNLTRVRPEHLDFYVSDFHWGTLQYHLIELALLLAQGLGFVSAPWRDSFINFHPIEYARIFVAGRAASAVLGSCSILLAYHIGSILYNPPTGVLAAVILALIPLHVVNSHYLTSDVTMVFLVLLAFWRLLRSLEAPTFKNHLIAGVTAGLAVTAKYNAAYLLPAGLAAQIADRRGTWKNKAAFYLGIPLGWVLGEPYAFVYPRQFWDSVQPYIRPQNLSEGTLPGVMTLTISQTRNLLLFGLGLPLASVAFLAVALRIYSLLSNHSRKHHSIPWRQYREVIKGGTVLLAAAILAFLVSVIQFRYPLIRYTLPLMALLVFPLAALLHDFARNQIRGHVVSLGLLMTGLLSFAQVKILNQTHPANQTARWIERHLPPEASIKKCWPEIPMLNAKKFQITNFFGQPRLMRFEEFFNDGSHLTYPDYVLLDNLSMLKISPAFRRRLDEHYCLVAEFRQPPRIAGLEIPEWNPPHDWKYSHPELRLYRRRSGLQRTPSPAGEL